MTVKLQLADRTAPMSDVAGFHHGSAASLSIFSGFALKFSGDVPPAAKAEAHMMDADFWLDHAMMLRQRAETIPDPEERDALRELAQICDNVARRIEEHAPGG
jgi:hypothetical protein